MIYNFVVHIFNIFYISL